MKEAKGYTKCSPAITHYTYQTHLHVKKNNNKQNTKIERRKIRYEQLHYSEVSLSTVG